jgi:hypothetical protein
MALIISAAFYKFLREDKLSKNEKKQFEEIEGTVADKVQTNYLS